MADRDLIDKWLADAEDAAPSDLPAQIAWLREKRKAYSLAMEAGDWEVNNTSHEGGSHTAKRGISDSAHHAAILAAIRKLEALAGTGTDNRSGSMLTLRTHDILS
jgi:hypothetical protein